MARILRRETAKRDLVEQYIWYAEHASSVVADRFFLAVDRTLHMLAPQPQLGSPISLRGPALQGLRKFPVSAHFDAVFLIYLPLADGVDLIRVIHSKRELARILHKDPSRR